MADGTQLHVEAPLRPTADAEAKQRPTPWLLWAAALAAAAGVVALALRMDEPRQSRAALVAGVCLVLWLTELIPLYATTVVLWAGTALLLGPLDARQFSLSQVLSWAANPVMALFFGGFALSVAGSKYGIDASVARWMIRVSRGRQPLLLMSVMAGTAVLSMWMSNIAAAAMMIATLRPLFNHAGPGDGQGNFRKALLLGIAFAADFGGMGTPIGSGPNLIAVGAANAIAPQHRITFAHWMLFALPLTVLMLILSYLLLTWLHGVRGAAPAADIPRPRLGGRGRAVVVIFFLAVVGWLTEPLHKVPAGVTALAVAAALFGGRLLATPDLAKMEWDTLLLVAGGLTLGELFERSGLARSMAAAVNWKALHPAVFLLAFIGVCALLSAVASNTAAAAMLIQIGLGIVPAPSFAVLVALGASMGVPFVISTPPNAMAHGQRGLRPRDFLLPGLILMIVGCVLLALTGPAVLRLMGVP
jgi:solute carrier family 13 (sodium-dependent dicarboxylate transporter), member 2/3/5